MGARAQSEAAAAVARAFETASCSFAREVAERVARTARASGVDPGAAIGDSGDDIVEAPRRLEGDGGAEPPDASGPATTSFASPGGHHVGLIQYHPPVAATAEGAYAPALERARRAFGAPSFAESHAEARAERLGDASRRDAFPRGGRAAGGSGSEPSSPFGPDRRDDGSDAAPDSQGSGGIFVETAHAFGSRPSAEPTPPFRWRSGLAFFSAPTRRALAALPLDAQTRFAGAPDASVWDLEVAAKLGGGAPSVAAAEIEEARDERENENENARSEGARSPPRRTAESPPPANVFKTAREKARRFLLRRFFFAERNPSSLETTGKKVSPPPRASRGETFAGGAATSADASRNFLTKFDSSSAPAEVSVLASPAPPSAFLCARCDGWGARELEFELAGGTFAKRREETPFGAESATRTRRSWTAAVDLTGATKPTVEWVDVTEKDETERERRVFENENENDASAAGFVPKLARVRSTQTRVRFACRSPLAFAGLHPAVRALQMVRRRRATDDRAIAEIRRVRSPWQNVPNVPKGKNQTDDSDARIEDIADVLDARFVAEARPSFLRLATRWRKARTFERTFVRKNLKRVTSRATYAVTHEGVDTVARSGVGVSSHAFRQKASFEADVVARASSRRDDATRRERENENAPKRDEDDASFGKTFVPRRAPSAAWRARLSVSSRLRSARETPSLTFSCAREGARWTVTGEMHRPGSAREGDARETSARETAFAARRDCSDVSEKTAASANRVSDAPPFVSGAFVECRLSLVGGDTRAFAAFATGASG